MTLCARPRAPDEVLLALFDRFDGPGGRRTWSGWRWGTCSRRRAPGFAARVLRAWEVHRWVRVWDGRALPPYGFPSDSVPGDGVWVSPPDCPPVARYELEQEQSEWRPGEVLVLGPRTIWVRRWVDDPSRHWTNSMAATSSGPTATPAGTSGSASGSASRRRTTPAPSPPVGSCGAARVLRVDLDAGAGIPAWNGVANVRWTGRQPWDRETTRSRHGSTPAFWRLVGLLGDAGLLTPEEARGLAPRVAFSLRDERSGSAPLSPHPPSPATEPVVPPAAPLGHRAPLTRAVP